MIPHKQAITLRKFYTFFVVEQNFHIKISIVAKPNMSSNFLGILILHGELENILCKAAFFLCSQKSFSLQNHKDKIEFLLIVNVSSYKRCIFESSTFVGQIISNSFKASYKKWRIFRNYYTSTRKTILLLDSFFAIPSTIYNQSF